jgi:uncharacterized protein YejL (UPF0352 family)
MSVRLTKAEHEALYQELVALLNKHAGKLDAIEMLAVASNMIGKMIAMQDQRKYTGPQVMEVVARNIEAGNQHVLKELGMSKGRA